MKDISQRKLYGSMPTEKALYYGVFYKIIGNIMWLSQNHQCKQIKYMIMTLNQNWNTHCSDSNLTVNKV